MKRHRRRLLVVLIAGVLASLAWRGVVKPAHTAWLIHQAGTPGDHEAPSRQRLYERLLADPQTVRRRIENELDPANPYQTLSLRAVLDQAGLWGPVQSPVGYASWLSAVQRRLNDPGTPPREARFMQEQLLRFAATDPATQATLNAALLTATDERFRQLRILCDQRGVWRRPLLSDAVFTRWLRHEAASPQAAPKIAAAEWIARTSLHEAIPEGFKHVLLDLLHDPGPAVQRAALDAACLNAWRAPDWFAACLAALDQDPDWTDDLALIRRLQASEPTGTQTAPTVAVDIDSLQAAIHHPRAAVRSLAALLWATTPGLAPPSPPQVAAWITADDGPTKRSGALLAGALGLHQDLLDQRELTEKQADVKDVLRMALWAHDRYAPMHDRIIQRVAGKHDTLFEAAALLVARRDRRVLDWLLSPVGEPSAQAINLIYAQRWVGAIQQRLPQDAPRLAEGASAAQNQAAYETARVWYRLHRHCVWSTVFP